LYLLRMHFVKEISLKPVEIQRRIGGVASFLSSSVVLLFLSYLCLLPSFSHNTHHPIVISLSLPTISLSFSYFLSFLPKYLATED